MADELADLQASEAEGQVDNAAVETTDNTPAQKPEKPASIRDSIQAAVKEGREAAERARDNTGKFVKAEAAPEPKAAPDKPISETTAEQQPAASSPQQVPTAWKDHWETLSPAAKALAVKREEEVAKGFEEYRQKTATLKEIEQVIAPRRASFQRFGIQSDAQAISRLFEWERAVSENPVQGILALARNYGVDLTKFAQPSGQVSEQEQIPAALRPVVDQFGQVTQTVQNLDQRFNAFQQEQMQRELQAFAAGKPHYERVRADMAELIAGAASVGRALSLEDAYQKAIYANPETRALIEQEAKTKAEAEAKKAAEDKARAARLAASSVRSAPTTGSVAQTQGKSTAKSVRESINEARKQVQEARA